MLKIRHDLHHVSVGGTPVFLDVAADRYFLLSGGATQSFEAFIAGDATADDLRRLAQLGIVADASENSGTPHARPEMPRAESSLIDTGPSRFSLTMLARAVALQIGYSLLVPRRQLLTTVNAARAAKVKAAHQRRHASVDEAAVAAAFYHAQHILPSADKCLPRSFAMADMLRRTGHHPTIVFGVQLPFAAHCWVQCEDRVVSDPLAHVVPFTPILAI